MGKFKAYRQIYRLKFEGDYRELEISAHGASMGEFMELGDQPDRLDAGAGLFAVRGLLELFMSKVKGWNLQHETLDDQFEDTPITVAGLLLHDPKLVKLVIRAWSNALIDVDEELGKDSNSGSTFPEESMPMDVL